MIDTTGIDFDRATFAVLGILVGLAFLAAFILSHKLWDVLAKLRVNPREILAAVRPQVKKPQYIMLPDYFEQR